MQRGAEPLAKFLLDAVVCALRLDEKIDPNKKDDSQQSNTADQPKKEPAEPFHPPSYCA